MVSMLKEAREFVNKFKNSNIACGILKEKKNVRLCNLINNSAYTHIEDMEIEPEIAVCKYLKIH